MSYDVKCVYLAEAFLQDNQMDCELFVNELSQRIQDTIEQFIEEKAQP